jgi:ribonucleoside-diphosphate reductase alpha chain
LIEHIGEINVSDVENQTDLNDRVSVAAFFGTLQAGFTDFHYLRPIWKQTTDKDGLLGIGMTGIGSGKILEADLEIAANTATVVNSTISAIIGTNEAARVTCIKPSGTTSCVLGTASGIHAWHAPYYLRTIRFNKNEDIAMFMQVNHPELCEDDVLRPKDTLCIRIPIKAPEGSIFRTETAIDTLERVKKFSIEWVKAGHVNGDNTHNVSATISVNNDEWPTVGEWMWNERDHYNGLSVLPYFGGSYKQAPFEDITEEEYNSRINHLKSLDLTKVMEIDDNVEFGQTVACASGQCDIS